MRPWLVALLVTFLVPLSGCSGGADSSAADLPDDEDVITGPDGLPLEAAPADLRFEVGKPEAGSLWINDTIALSDSCNVNPTSGCVEQPHDVTDLLPVGVPVEVVVDLSWTPTEPVIFHMEARLSGEELEFWRIDNSTLEVGHWQWTALVVPKGQVQADVISGGFTDPAQASENPYTLTVAYSVSNDTVPPYMAVEVALRANQTVSAKDDLGNPAGFLVYGPDDLVLDTARGAFTLPSNATEGKYIFVAEESITYRTLGGGVMQLVGYRYEEADRVPVPGGSSAQVTLDTVGQPLIAGMFYYGQQQLPVLFATQIHLSLTGPDGAELIVDDACVPFCAGGFSNWWSTDPSDGNLLQGTYTLTVESDAAYDTYASLYLTYFDRPTSS